MRISDWSSDVCSSDLRLPPCAALGEDRLGGLPRFPGVDAAAQPAGLVEDEGLADQARHLLEAGRRLAHVLQNLLARDAIGQFELAKRGDHGCSKSEEHRGGKECVRRCRSWW